MKSAVNSSSLGVECGLETLAAHHNPLAQYDEKCVILPTSKRFHCQLLKYCNVLGCIGVRAALLAATLLAATLLAATLLAATLLAATLMAVAVVQLAVLIKIIKHPR